MSSIPRKEPEELRWNGSCWAQCFLDIAYSYWVCSSPGDSSLQSHAVCQVLPYVSLEVGLHK